MELLEGVNQLSKNNVRTEFEINAVVGKYGNNQSVFVRFLPPINYLSPVRTSHFASAEFNANTENLFVLPTCIRFGACEMRRLNWALPVYIDVFYSRET